MVKYLEYKGEQLPFKVGYFAISRWQVKTGKTLDDLNSIENNLALIEPLLYYSLQAGHKLDNKKFKLKLEDIPWMLEEEGFLNQFMEKMADFSLGMEPQVEKS